jgi:hypothetical protein
VQVSIIRLSQDQEHSLLVSMQNFNKKKIIQ